MSEIDSITDIELRTAQPRSLDQDFLARLTACADGSQLELSSIEIEFEQSLRSINPGALPDILRASIEAAIADTPFHSDEKIVLFNRAKEPTAQAPRQRFWTSRANVAAAAAVAILGSISALFIPNAGTATNNHTASIQPIITTNSSPTGNANNNSAIAPVSYNRNLSHTSDEGVIWPNNNSPHRVLRLSFVDRFTVTNPQGETVEMERPRDEYVIIPEKVD